MTRCGALLGAAVSMLIVYFAGRKRGVIDPLGLLLTGISGLIGVGISWAFMALLQAVLTDKIPGFDPPRIVPWSVALALGSLTLSGIAAGLYPASKAAALDPIEALRKE